MNLYEEVTLAEGQVIIHEVLDLPHTSPPIFIAFGSSKKAIEDAWGEKFGKDYNHGDNVVPIYPNYKQEYESRLNYPPTATLLEIYPGMPFDALMYGMILLAQEMLTCNPLTPETYKFIERLMQWVKDPMNDDPFGTME